MNAAGPAGKSDGKKMVAVSYPAHAMVPLAEAMNYVHFAHAGGDVLMSVGQIDVVKIASSRSDSNLEIEANVTHRFMMSVQTFMRVRRQLNEVAEVMEANGMQLRTGESNK